MKRDDLKRLKKELGDDGKFIEIFINRINDNKSNAVITKLLKDFEYDSTWIHLHLNKTFEIQENLENKYFLIINEIFPFVEKVFVWTTTLSSEEISIQQNCKMLKSLEGCKHGVYDRDCWYIIKIPKNFKIENLDEKVINGTTIFINE